MTQHYLHQIHPKTVRDTLNSAVEKSDELSAIEKELISLLTVIDQQRFYLRYGFRSLRPFCETALRLTRVQAQRIVTEVRRSKDIAHTDDVRFREFRNISKNTADKRVP